MFRKARPDMAAGIIIGAVIVIGSIVIGIVVILLLF
jgi:hypothetical protein